MVVTRSPEGRDIDRPLSGPHIPVAGIHTSESDVPADSQPEEQAKSARGASKDVTESVDESTDDRSMETSSDGGSTVRELNRQLESSDEDDDGNSNGMVSDSGENSNWEQQRRVNKRALHSSGSLSKSSNASKPT